MKVEVDAASYGRLVRFGTNVDGTERVARIWTAESFKYQTRLRALRARRFGAAARNTKLLIEDQARAAAECLIALVVGDVDRSVAGIRTRTRETVQCERLEVASAWYDDQGLPIADSISARLRLLADPEFMTAVFLEASIRPGALPEQPDIA